MCKIVGLNVGVKVFGGVCICEDVDKMVVVGVFCVGVSVSVVIVLNDVKGVIDNY